MSRKIIIALTAGMLVLSSAACNTVRGVAQDLDDAADDVDRAV